MIWPRSTIKSGLTGAILCGGKSSRMGTPKAGLLLDSGLTMVEHVYRALGHVCERIVFVGHALGVPEPLLNAGKHIRDEIPGLGPLGALDALLSSGLDHEYIVTPCDLNKASPSLYFLLAKEQMHTPTVLSHQGNLEPLIGRYSQKQLAQIRLQLRERDLSIRSLLLKCHAQAIEVPRHLRCALKNANTPQDLIPY